MTQQQPQNEDEVELVVLEQDIKSQMRRLKSLLDNGSAAASPDLGVREILHTVFPLMLDHLKLTDRLEEHAEWAGEQLDYLAGDNQPPTSQLLPEDADRFAAYVDKVTALCNATLSALPLGDETARQRSDLVAIVEAGAELRTLVDELRVDDSGDDDGDGEPQTKTLQAPAEIVNLPAPENGSA